MTEARKTVAVLGGTGTLGRVLCSAFVAQGYDVLSVARTAPAVPTAGRFVQLDVSTAPVADLTAFLDREQVSLVVNAAGSPWGLSEEQMQVTYVVLVEHLLEAIPAMAAPARLVHLGSVHEAGLAPVGVSQREDGPVNPVNPYGRLKLVATDLVVKAVEAGTIDGVVLRLAHSLGAGQANNSLLGVITGKLNAARQAGETAQLSLQPLAAERDFINIEDTADAIVAAARPTRSPLIHIGTGRATTARSAVESLIEVSGVPVEITEVPAPGDGGPETEWQQMDISIAREELGWEPKRTIRAAVEAMWLAKVNAPEEQYSTPVQ
ncbi:NAD-dependent epimerase/dehydratase family protein [Kitasatospora sp. NPDC092948]|uniref:NAD-dependent epimerase/dehydratase family protein n=1 Tax=Kitasatospora sp. NPDC092948 TaxID=3364088 RepID=UPI0037F50A8A